MDTRISGRKVAAAVTTVVALGSFSVAGIAAVAVDMATASHAATSTPTTSQDNGYYSGNSGGSSVQPGNGGTTSGRSSGS